MAEQFLTIREKNILSFLIKSERYITAAELSKELNVSQKTIYRDLQAIRDKFGGSQVIVQNRGKGYSIASGMSKDFFGSNSGGNSFNGMDVDTRRRNIMILLLLQTPMETSINKLAELYYISQASIVNDLNIIEDELEVYGLSLVRSRNGTHIEGKENNIRRLLMQKINQFAYESEQALFNASETAADTHNLAMFFSPKDIGFVKLLLDKTEKMLYGKIKDPYYINIFTHILILLKRLEHDDKLLGESENIAFDYNDKVVESCTKMIINNLENYLNISIPANEIYHIYQYLYSSRIDMENEQVQLNTDGASEDEKQFVEYLIQSVSADIGIDLCLDVTLKRDLILHLRPLKKRLESNIFISNPLKKDIKHDFAPIFIAVRKAVSNKTDKCFNMLSDDEIAYLVVYFQLALEKRQLNRRVGIVCSTGVGTSHLLAARVKRAFPEWQIVDIVSSNHADRFTAANVDLVLTTIKLEKKDIPCILVSALFSEVDVAKVKQKINII